MALIRRSPIRSGKPGLLVVVLAIFSLVLAACGDNNQDNLVPPTPTLVLNNFRQDSDSNLFISVTVFSDWQKTSSGSSVTFSPATAKNVGLTVKGSTISNLQPNSTQLVEQHVNEIKSSFGATQEGSNDTLTLSDREVTLRQISYKNSFGDVTELMTQINVAAANQAYLVYGFLPTADFTGLKDKLKLVMGSMRFNPPKPTVVPALTAIITTQAPEASNRGLITPIPGTNETRGEYLTFISWSTPSLTTGQAAIVTLSGNFPARWNWTLKNFPGSSDPGIYLNAPKPGPFGQSSTEATMNIGVVQNAFSTDGTPTADEWKKAYGPVYDRFSTSILPALGAQVNIQLPVDASGLKKSDFTVRSGSDQQSIRTTGQVIFRKVGRAMLVGVIYISPDGAVNNKLVSDYETDFSAMMNTLLIGSGR